MNSAIARVRLRNPQIRQMAGNTAWLVAERLIRGAVAVTVTVAVARYLGPAQFGTLNYALSFVLLFGTFWTLGLSGVVVRELVREPSAHDEILGSLFVLRLIGGAIGITAILAVSSMVGPTDPATRAAIALIAGATLFYAFDGVDYWLQAELRSRHAVVARVFGLLLMACLNVVFIVTAAPFLAFAVASGVELVAAGIALGVMYVILGRSPFTWRPSWDRAKELASKSWPLMLSGAMYSLNLKIDQLMLGNMSSAQSVGTYAAAARISEVWYFIPTAIAASAFPAMVRSRAQGGQRYAANVQRLYDLMVWLALPLAIGVTVASGSLIHILFGDDYAASAPILAVHIWAGPFVFLGAVLSRWLIAEDLLKFSMVRHGAGAAVNIGINLFAIPRWGGLGAAIATLISYAVASYGASVLYAPTRRAAWQMTLALLVPLRALSAAVARVSARR